ncbi:MAG: response regulator, partial [Bacteroidales bacterium]|nr:response regulator [Bacteroidales bacterium]
EPGSNTAKYVNLPPGKYVFRVKSYSGGPTDNVTMLDIRIKLPLWASPLLLGSYILLLLFIILVIVYQYRNRMKYRAQVNLIQIEKEQNERLNASKIKFFVNISHELLTSIGLVIDPVKNLLSHKEIEGNFRNTLKLIERNAHFLKVYVDQLLNFRKIELGHEVRRFDDRLELISFCKEVVAFFKGKAISKGVTLKLKAEIREVIIDTDEEKLYSILQNLLSNAIKFTPRGGSVGLAVKNISEHEVLIEVKDKGIGIPVHEHQKIFERFYQVTNEDSVPRGSGIGLTIVKDFVEILNGRIELESKVGEGTVIRVILPVQKLIAVKQKDQVYVKEIVTKDTIRQVHESAFKALNVSSELPIVLIVDENRDLYDYIRASLKTKFSIIWVPNGNDALEIISKNIPTIIISEIQLPDIDGISFCRKIRKDVRTSRVPFIFLTARTETEHQLEAIEAGVDVFLAKPIEIEVLEANISNLISRMQRTEEFINRRLLLNAQQVEVDSSDDRLLKEVVEYIYKNMTNSRITADEISHALGISHSNLYRKIKSITGQSLSEFIRFVRLQKAEQLLSKGKHSVSEIMFQVGFTNHSYFSKCFKKLYNVSPKNYKAN